MLSVYGVDLRELWTGGLTVRRAAVLAAQLPPGSRVWGAGMSDAAWTSDDYWAAAIIDAVQRNSWLVANRGVEQSKQSQQPAPIDRPADIRAAREKARKTERNARAFAAAWKRRQTEKADT